MFQLKQVFNSAKNLAVRCQDTIRRYCALFVLGFMCGMQAFAQGAGGFSKATQEISTYSGPVQKLMYAIAAVIALVGAFNVYFKMQNGDQDVKRHHDDHWRLCCYGCHVHRSPLVFQIEKLVRYTRYRPSNEPISGYYLY